MNFESASKTIIDPFGSKCFATFLAHQSLEAPTRWNCCTGCLQIGHLANANVHGHPMVCFFVFSWGALFERTLGCPGTILVFTRRPHDCIICHSHLTTWTTESAAWCQDASDPPGAHLPSQEIQKGEIKEMAVGQGDKPFISKPTLGP